MSAAAITPEQLRLAWRHISRPGWPPTLEAALELPAYRVALLGIARNLGRRGMDVVPASPPAAPQLPLFAPPEPAGGHHAAHPHARARRHASRRVR